MERPLEYTELVTRYDTGQYYTGDAAVTDFVPDADTTGPFFDGTSPIDEIWTPDGETGDTNTLRVDKPLPFSEALDRLSVPVGEERLAYTAEDANAEQPYTHYSGAQHIFGILSYGIQSRGFKERLNAERATNPQADTIGRHTANRQDQKGASYQTDDSVCLGWYDESKFVPNRSVIFLVSPHVWTLGADSSDRNAEGYGYGITERQVGDYTIGNDKAYQYEELAAGVVLPADLRAVVVGPYSSILRESTNLLRIREHAGQYTWDRGVNAEGAAAAAHESLMASSRLLAAIVGDPDIHSEVETIAAQAPSQGSSEIAKALYGLHKKALQRFVGDEVPLTEKSLRTAISKRFNINFIAVDDLTRQADT
jgi:hypothetical protein